MHKVKENIDSRKVKSKFPAYNSCIGYEQSV